MKELKVFLQKHPSIFIVILLFYVALKVYTGNEVSISSGDIIPTSMMAFNLLEHHTIHLDPLRGGYIYDIFGATVENPPYFFNETPSGHLASGYPVGPALISFPLYVGFYIYLKLSQIPIDLNSMDFEVYRVFFEKQAASILAALTAVMFYLSSRLKFSLPVALISTLTFAFATNQWMISSQGLWQHGVSNLVLITTIYCLFKANRTQGNQQRLWLLLGGLACGLFPSIRPSSNAFLLASIIYCLWTYRKQSIFFLVGLISASIGFIWNLYYYGNLVGGYGGQIGNYQFTVQQFVGAFIGLLISPSRGIFIFSPILLLSFWGIYKIWQNRHHKDEQLLGVLILACLLIFSNYCLFKWWSGLNCWGARFLTDILPILGYGMNYTYHDIFQGKFLHRQKSFMATIGIALLLSYSLFVQEVGAYGNSLHDWKSYAVDSDTFDYRNWDIRDSMIERHARVYFRRNAPSLNLDHEGYINNLQGEILDIREVDVHFQDYIHNLINIRNLRGEADEINHPDNQPLVFPLSVEQGTRLFLRAELKNTGSSTWYGYETGIKRGNIRIRLRWFDQNNQPVAESYLHVYGVHRKGETAAAVGTIDFPQEATITRLDADLILNEIADFPSVKNGVSYQLTTQGVTGN